MVFEKLKFERIGKITVIIEPIEEPAPEPTPEPVPEPTPEPVPEPTPTPPQPTMMRWLHCVGGAPGEITTVLNEFTELVGQPIYALSCHAANWGESMRWVTSILQDNLNSNKIKAIALIWNPFTSYSDSQTLVNIINGLEDEYIRSIAQEIKAIGYPVYIRLGAEFNLHNGGAWGGNWADNPNNFIIAWKRIVGIFMAEAVANANWVWNPNCSDDGTHHFDEYYPGDSYVDWVGIDIYQYEDSSNPNNLISEVYNKYAHKQIGLFEWGTNAYDWTGIHTPDAKRAQFIMDLKAALLNKPAIKLITYWFYGSYRFDAVNNPLTTTAYKLLFV